MGVHDGGNAPHHSHNMTFNQLTSLVRDRAAGTGRQGRPAVALDTNWICIVPHLESDDDIGADSR